MALAYLRLKAHQPDEVISELFESLRETERNRAIEIRAVIRIQKWMRGWMARRYLQILHGRATEMQRLWRGYQGRQRVKTMREKIFELQSEDYYNYLATKIQKVWRGYISRRKKHDFYKRREYIRKVSVKSQKVLEALEQTERENFERMREEKERKMAMKFADLTSNMHHLLSTKSQPGVFNASGFTTTAFGIPIEEHIKHNFSQTRQHQLTELQKSIREKYNSTANSRKAKANFYPFGSRARRFQFSEPPDPLGPTTPLSNVSPTSQADSQQFTWSSHPSPVHTREVRRKKLRAKEQIMLRGH
mmetsp:Transcript_8270/g.11721  ORF Transcript_8270/g.11721 Transcript_8270/m.11721 type:complete len:304 (+) Transcript_8270:89-1000(+)